MNIFFSIFVISILYWLIILMFNVTSIETEGVIVQELNEKYYFYTQTGRTNFFERNAVPISQ